ncbi:hypothetical protein BC829DRAFT_390749 [Chytridium lagenaria]|nr:hypothetical protein BC829DRAFT_390749 [Chytridium lagenaria]
MGTPIASDHLNSRTVSSLHSHISLIDNPNRSLLCPEPITLTPNLIIRRCTPEDVNAIAEFNGYVHGSPTYYGGHARSCFDHLPDNIKHPSVDAGCFTAVIDTSVTLETVTDADKAFMTTDGMVVSCMMSIPQIWTYGETTRISSDAPRVPLLTMRPEAVGTHPSYRSQKLTEKQFAIHDTWSEALGHDISFLIGIEGFYRRFGYELAPQCLGGRRGYAATLPKLGKDETEPYVIRKATLEDAVFLTDIDRRAAARRRHLSCDVDEAWWRNMIGGKLQKGAHNDRDIFIIEEAAAEGSEILTGNRVGFFQTSPHLQIIRFEVDPDISGHSWTSVTPTLLRWLPVHSLSKLQAKDPAATLPESWSFSLSLAPNHPCFSAIRSDLHLPRIVAPYRMYTKIPNLPVFLNRISSVLTYRLQRSIVFNHYTGSLALVINPSNAAKNGGTVLTITDGRITDVSPAKEGSTLDGLMGDGVNNAFTMGGSATWFVQIVMGMETASGMAEKYPGDCASEGMATRLLDVMFPRKAMDSEDWGVNCEEVYPVD